MPEQQRETDVVREVHSPDQDSPLSPQVPPRSPLVSRNLPAVSVESPSRSEDAEGAEGRSRGGFADYWRSTSMAEKMITFGGGYMAARFLIAGQYGIAAGVLVASVAAATAVANFVSQRRRTSE